MSFTTRRIRDGAPRRAIKWSLIAVTMLRVLQPVLGNVAVNEGIGRNCGEAKNEQKPQRDGGQRDEQKEPEMLAHEFAHGGNISRFARISNLDEYDSCR